MSLSPGNDVDKIMFAGKASKIFNLFSVIIIRELLQMKEVHIAYHGKKGSDSTIL